MSMLNNSINEVNNNENLRVEAYSDINLINIIDNNINQLINEENRLLMNKFNKTMNEQQLALFMEASKLIKKVLQGALSEKEYILILESIIKKDIQLNLEAGTMLSFDDFIEEVHKVMYNEYFSNKFRYFTKCWCSIYKDLYYNKL